MGTSEAGGRIVQSGIGRPRQAHVARIERRVAPAARRAGDGAA